jgi:murein DD-endopeptidase MepM/ murein hydrolase activator NlpD
VVAGFAIKCNFVAKLRDLFLLLQPLRNKTTLEMRNYWIISFCLLLFTPDAFSQVKKEQKYKQNNLQIRNKPPVKKVEKPAPKPKPDSLSKETQDSLRQEPIPFNPNKIPNLITDRVNELDTAETSIIKVSEYLKIDCVWVKAADYYSIWSSSYINPYRKDPAYFKDTVHLTLYDEARGQFWAKPLDEILLTSHFGFRWGRMHQGIDLNLRTGTPIYSIFDGIVRIATFGGGYGYYVVVRHANGLETLYAHMSRLSCQVGQVVRAGELLGLGGSTGYSTGPHLHLEVLYAGTAFNPLYIFELNPKSEIPFVRSKFFDLTPSHFRHIGTIFKKDYYHIVTRGETLLSIAKKYGTTVQYLAKINQLPTNAMLRVGQRLKIK